MDPTTIAQCNKSMLWDRLSIIISAFKLFLLYILFPLVHPSVSKLDCVTGYIKSLWHKTDFRIKQEHHQSKTVLGEFSVIQSHFLLEMCFHLGSNFPWKIEMYDIAENPLFGFQFSWSFISSSSLGSWAPAPPRAMRIHSAGRKPEDSQWNRIVTATFCF